MPNEQLRATMADRGMTAQALAEAVEVDPKTVERWLNADRVPFTRFAVRVGQVLEVDPVTLWPTLRRGRVGKSVPSDVVAVYAQRAEVSPATWRDFFAQAGSAIDILVYAANHLHESVPGFGQMLAVKARAGVRIRVALGDPAAPQIAQRGAEEPFGHGIESRCELALLHYRPLLDIPGVEIRTHGTTLYNSIYRVDDEALVNTHLWGANAFTAPIWHLRKRDGGGLFHAYTQSFEQVWDRASGIT